ncbi:glycosyltransferase [Photobacterium aphoticum]|uniref:Glycosyltransferase n=1 Tax=Photobacterium aphoticum TaxID=754436 RepID=A0A090RCE7_9GAMM|nr:glycosyltransferase [Photobacterium aphoticum]
MTARGTDINLIPQFPRPLQQIQHVFKQAQHNLAVCEALRQTMILHGADPARSTTARNGVDLTLFPFADKQQQQALRTQLGLPADKPIFLSVGWLIERKGHHLVIDAMLSHPDALLLIAGTGPNEKALKQQAINAGIEKQVIFLGGLDQPTLAHYFAASDLSILPQTVKAGPMYYWNPWHAGHPSSPPIFGGHRKWSHVLMREYWSSEMSPALQKASPPFTPTFRIVKPHDAMLNSFPGKTPRTCCIRYSPALLTPTQRTPPPPLPSPQPIRIWLHENSLPPSCRLTRRPVCPY